MPFQKDNFFIVCEVVPFANFQGLSFSLGTLKVDDPDIVQALIVFGADVNITNKRHETPRHVATVVHQHCWRDVVRALGFVGAAACDKSKNGCTLECSKPFQEEMTIGKYSQKSSVL